MTVTPATFTRISALLGLLFVGGPAYTASTGAPALQEQADPASRTAARPAMAPKAPAAEPSASPVLSEGTNARTRFEHALSEDPQYASLQNQLDNSVRQQDWNAASSLAVQLDAARNGITSREQIDSSLLAPHSVNAPKPAPSAISRAVMQKGAWENALTAIRGSAGGTSGGSAATGSPGSPSIGSPGSQWEWNITNFTGLTPENSNCVLDGSQSSGDLVSVWSANSDYNKDRCVYGSLWRYAKTDNPAPAKATALVHFKRMHVETRNASCAKSKALARAVMYVKWSSASGPSSRCMVLDKAESIGPNSKNESTDLEFTATCELGSVSKGLLKIGPQAWIEADGQGGCFTSAHSFASVDKVTVLFKY